MNGNLTPEDLVTGILALFFGAIALVYTAIIVVISAPFLILKSLTGR